jgi:hypothetical protein
MTLNTFQLFWLEPRPTALELLFIFIKTVVLDPIAFFQELPTLLAQGPGVP